MRRATCVLCATILLGAVLRGQGPGAPRRDPAIELLAADAASVPPEFEADVLLRISQLSKVDKEWRRELLDTAYMRAYAAPEQHRRATTREVPAVELMAFVEPLHARDLFEWIDLNLAPGVCADPLVPAVDEYYTALG